MPTAFGAGGLGGLILRSLITHLAPRDPVRPVDIPITVLAEESTCPSFPTQLEFFLSENSRWVVVVVLSFRLGAGFTLGFAWGYSLGLLARFAPGPGIREPHPRVAGYFAA